MKVFKKKSVWAMLTIYFAIWLVIAIVGGLIAEDFKDVINVQLGLESSRYETDENAEEVDAEYFKSAFVNADGSMDSRSLWDYNVKLAERVQAEGATVLWNHDSKGSTGLPLGRGSKVSVFGRVSADYLTSGGGSGRAFPTKPNEPNADAPTVLSAFTDAGLSVNKTLYDYYASVAKSTYADTMCVTVNEVPWAEVNGKCASSFPQFGDAAVIILGRWGGEGEDMSPTSSDCMNGDYLQLHKNEKQLIEEVIKLKNNGTFRKAVLLLNTPNGLDFDLISAYRNDLDCCVWVGQSGYVGVNAVGKILTGEYTASGHLPDTFVYNYASNPVTANGGSYAYTNVSSFGLTGTNYEWMATYRVYAESIYVGYKYYETRYEDAVLNQGNARGTAGTANSGDGWKYGEEVIFPFGYGSAYTQFEYSDFHAEEQDGGSYAITVKVTNTGGVDLADAVQIYIQKPYTDHDRQYGIEQSAVELCGYIKTPVIGAGKSETVKITVDADAFKTYDANYYKTYIKEAGTFYLTAAQDAHAAVNNILAAKEKTPDNTNGVMDAEGDASLVKSIVNETVDTETYCLGANGEKITNRFDDADWNKYENKTEATVTYLTRSNWNTFPETVYLTLSDTILNDLSWDKPFEETETKFPVYGAKNGLNLIDLKGAAYDDPRWEKLLDQMTVQDQSELLHGIWYTALVTNINKPTEKLTDGPLGIREKYKDWDHQTMTFPSATLLAATFNDELARTVGDGKGEDMLHAGVHGLYGTAMNIHRSPYGGRNFEYYSEDAFLSGRMGGQETAGIQGGNLNGDPKGTYVTLKHFALNDTDANRRGIATYANEQSVREIYLKAYERSVINENARSVMASFTRIGTTWCGASFDLMTGVLREEWGFDGYVISDANRRYYMAVSDALRAGCDYLLGGTMDVTSEYKAAIGSSPTLAHLARESCKRLLYVCVNNSGINGLSSNMRVVSVRNWWQNAILGAQIGIGCMAGIFALMFGLCFVFGTARKQQEFAEKAEGRAQARIIRYGSPEKAAAVVRRNKLIAAGAVALAVVMTVTAIAVPLAVKNAPIADIAIARLEMVTPPSRLNYTEGETFNAAGAEVTAYYEDGRWIYLKASDMEITPAGPLDLDDGEVKLSYKGVSVTVPITVREGSLLDKLPAGYTVTRFEAECCEIDSVANETTGQIATAVDRNGASGGQCLEYVGNAKSTVLTFNIYSDADAEAVLLVNMGRREKMYTFNSMFDFKVNGISANPRYDAEFPEMDSNGIRYYDWYTAEVCRISLQKGNNTLVMTKKGSTLNLDYIEIATTADVAWKTEHDVGGHAFGAWTVTKQPSALNAGIAERYCSTCRLLEEFTLPAISAEYYDERVITAAGADSFGLSEWTFKDPDDLGIKVVVQAISNPDSGVKETERFECERSDIFEFGGGNLKAMFDNNNNPSNGGYLNNFDTKDSFVTLKIHSDKKAQAVFIVNFGGRATTRYVANAFNLTHNGKPVAVDPAVGVAGAAGHTYYNWTEVQVCILELEAGENTLTFTSTGKGGMNMDYFRFISSATITAIEK